MQQDYDNGKYTVIFDERTGAMSALRNGEPWQDLSGNKLVYWMLIEHKNALDRIAELEKDAARYRWLRDICGIVEYKAAFGSIGQGMLPSGENLDAAIDTAMQKD